MLSYQEKEMIKKYINEHDIFKLTDICDYLISNGSSKAIYSTGKFKIYPLVGAYIKSIIHGSELEMTQTDNDVQYSKAGILNFEKEIEDNQMKENEIKKLGQLSLF